MTGDERRTARLMVGEPVGLGAGPALRRAVRLRPIPSAPIRLAQALAVRQGRLFNDRDVVGRAAAARREALGEAVAAEPPRVLVRMDEFPHARAVDRPERYGNDAFRRFHGIMRESGVPYLLAVTPRPCHSYLDPAADGDRALTEDERELLAQACAEGAEPAMHGLTHRTRDAGPRRHSELCGLSEGALRALIRRADDELAEAGVHPRVFVPPFNRFDAAQLPVLAERFDVVCAGPESIPLLGFQRGPAWRGETVLWPSLPPLYGRASEVLPGLEALAGRTAGAWVAVTLHMGWEVDDGWTALERLAGVLRPYASPWSEFLDAVDDSREG